MVVRLLCGSGSVALRIQCAAGFAYLVYWFKCASTTYEITTQIVRVERGLLSKAERSRRKVATFVQA
jgi:uncharacterized membrane protein YdbT with pleckstrin-like domain